MANTVSQEGLVRRIGEIVRLRYLGAKDAPFPHVENVLTDLAALGTSQYFIWTSLQPWLGSQYFAQYFARTSLSVAALTISFYNILWSVIVKYPSYAALSLKEKILEATVRLFAIASIIAAFFLLQREPVYFLLCFATSFVLVVVWDIAVPASLRQARGFFFQDIAMLAVGLVFCYFTWRLYAATLNLETLAAQAVNFKPDEYKNRKYEFVLAQMGPIIYVACCSTAMVAILFSAFLSLGAKGDADAQTKTVAT